MKARIFHGPGNVQVEEVERQAIVQALAAAHGKRILAANYLGIHRNRLARKIRKYRL